METKSVFCSIIYLFVVISSCQAEKPIILGHRGACGVYPEHTTLSYERAADFGADYIECDVQVTKVKKKYLTFCEKGLGTPRSTS